MTRAEQPQVVILGGGGHARVVAETLVALGRAPCGYLAPEPAALAGALGPYLGDDGAIQAAAGAAEWVFALGLGFVDRAGALHRARLLARLDPGRLVSPCHPAAVIAASARIGAGAFIGPGAIVGTLAEVGIGAIVNSGAIVEHDCRIGANTHVATGSRMGGNVRIGANTLVGAGATILQGVRIGEGVIVGAGAVVLRDVPDGATVTGIPARPREVPR